MISGKLRLPFLKAEESDAKIRWSRSATVCKEIILKPLSGSDLYETHLPLATFLVF